MKIQIHNFGPIHFFECDLEKDFHLIVGENNSGKSYAITVVYLILKSLRDATDNMSIKQLASFYEFSTTGGEIPLELANLKTGDKINITHLSKDILMKYKNEIFSFVERFQEYFCGTYGSVEVAINQFSDNAPSIRLLSDTVSIELSIEDNKIILSNISLKIDIIAQVSTESDVLESAIGDFTIPFTDPGGGFVILYNAKKNDQFKRAVFIVSMSIYFKMIDDILTDIPDIYYLPASRAGLYHILASFGQIIAELAKSRPFIAGHIELPGVAVPLSDYFLRLSQIEIDKKQHKLHPVNKISEYIESEILRGKVEFEGQNKKLFYTPADCELKLDISYTSSMVSELSPIVSFLRYVLTTPKKATSQSTVFNLAEFQRNTHTPKPILFIEEPEAHLHPENQLKLMRAFVKLVHADVKIIITSHSNYLFNKLNNLILEKAIDPAVIQASVFKHTDHGSDSIPLEIDELGIEDDNFIDVAEALYEEKAELIARLNNDA